jgi:hypothetical protein
MKSLSVQKRGADWIFHRICTSGDDKAYVINSEELNSDDNHLLVCI